MKAQVFYFIIFLLCWFFILWGLNKLIVKKLSYDIDKRYLHFRLFLAGLIVSFIVGNAATSSYALLLVDKIINSRIITNILNRILPNRAFELLYMLLCILGLNLIYVLVFIVTITITRLAFTRKNSYIEYEHCFGAERLFHAPWYIVNKFYSEKNGKIVLKSNGFILGIWVKGMKVVPAALWIGEIILLYFSILWGSEAWNERVLLISKSTYLIPMVAFLLIEQLQLFLEAPEDSEVGTFGSVDIKAKMIGDISTLTYSYVTKLGDSNMLLYWETGKGKGGEQQGYSGNDVGNQQLSDCDHPGILAVIINQLRASGIHQNPNYQNAVISMLNGSNITVRDYFDGEFLIYLCAYLNHFLAQGKSVLFLCHKKEDVAAVKTALLHKMEQLNNLDNVWNIASMEELNPIDHFSALICTFEELINSNINSDYKKLTNDLFFTVVVDSNLFLQQNNIRLGMIFSKLNSINGIKQYAFIADEDDSAVTAKIQVFIKSSNKIESYNNDYRLPRTDIMIWKNESIYKPQLKLRIGQYLSPHLGTALPIALIAVKYDLPQINIVSHPSYGDSYFFGDARKGNSNDINKYLETSELETSEYNLKSIIRYSPSEAVSANDLKMLIIYDTDYNFFNALWRWMKYGGSAGTLIHVVSPFYMMREYFSANFRKRELLMSNNEFTAIIPKETATKHSRLAMLLTELADHGMTEYELMAISKKYNWSYSNVADILYDALLTVLPSNEVHNIYEHFRFEPYPHFSANPVGYVYDTTVKLKDDNVINKQKGQIALAKMSFTNHRIVELPVLGGNLLNYYLPDQLAVISGDFYTVTSVGDGIVYMSNAAPNDIPDYYPVSGFYLSDYHIIDPCTDFRLVDINVSEASAIRTIYGYASCSCGNDLFNHENYSFHKFSGKDKLGISMEANHVAILEINILRDTFSSTETAEKAISLLCVVLSGMFKTLFPNTWQNLFAIPGTSLNDNVPKHILDNTDDLSFNDAVRALIPAISIKYRQSDDPASEKERKEKRERFISLYIVEFSCVEYGMVQSIRENFSSILDKAYKYLSWYAASNNVTESEKTESDIMKGTYLHFGAPSYPEIFAPEDLLIALQKIMRNTEPAPVIEPEHVEYVPQLKDSKYYCSFCNKEILFAWQLSDGRCMCLHCHDHQKTQRDEIESLYRDTVAALERFYRGVEFRKDIHVRFQSADAIRKAAGGIDNGRIVGFYNHSKQQLWIEARGPSVAMTSTIIHELTHSWQHDNLPLKELKKSLPKATAQKQITLLLEGHAVYIEIEAMRERGERTYSERLEKKYLNRRDVYGYGYKFVSEYIKSKITQGSHVTPFVAMQELVNDVIGKKVVVPCPKDI